MGENAPYCFSQNNHRINVIETMDYVDKSDVEVFTMKLTLEMYWKENEFQC